MRSRLERNAYQGKLSKMLKFLVILLAVLAVVIAVLGIMRASSAKNSIDLSKITMTQLDAPKKGQQIAVITTNKGEMRYALYPEFAPKTVENFIALCEEGYYTNTHIFDSEKGVYFIGGMKNKDGTGDAKPSIEEETSIDLWPFKGALCSLGKKNKGGAALLFVNSIDFTPEIIEDMKQSGENALTDKFIEKGGIPNFVRQYNVFAQIYDGWEVFEEISAANTDEKTRQPVEDIIIEKIEISNY